MHDAELTPEQEEQVRRLLAQARHEEPVPADVVARLDRVLVDLSRETAVEPADQVAGVVDLTARRRRRHAAALLAGAAAVIVGGFAVGQVIDVGGGAADSTGAASQPVDRDAAGGSAQDNNLAAPSATTPDGGQQPEASLAGGPLRLRSARLQQDLAEQLPSAEADGTFDASAPTAAQTFGCKPTSASAYGRGQFFPAYFDGVPAVVALRPPAHDTQRADVLECRTAAVLGSALLGRR